MAGLHAIRGVAGLSLTVPSIMAGSDAAYSPFVETATAQLSFVVVVSALATPLFVKMLTAKAKADNHKTHFTLTGEKQVEADRI